MTLRARRAFCLLAPNFYANYLAHYGNVGDGGICFLINRRVEKRPRFRRMERTFQWSVHPLLEDTLSVIRVRKSCKSRLLSEGIKVGSVHILLLLPHNLVKRQMRLIN